MQKCNDHFIEFLIKYKVLKFGEFTLKSGRISPYFFNLGAIQTGSSMMRLGEFYAKMLLQPDLSFDVLYGPAYKGIPLVVATAIALQNKYNINAQYAFNRKESKKHGEQGIFVGAPIEGKRIVMLDDVITAGTTVHETTNLIKNYNATLTGIIVAFDRQEYGQNRKSAIQEITEKLKIPIRHIITLSNLMDYLKKVDSLKKWIPPIAAYKKRYGTS